MYFTLIASKIQAQNHWRDFGFWDFFMLAKPGNKDKKFLTIAETTLLM